MTDDNDMKIVNGNDKESLMDYLQRNPVAVGSESDLIDLLRSVAATNFDPHKRQLLRDAAAEIERLRDVAGWAQAVLTALNTGSVVESGSPLHLKLRDVMIGYREAAAKGGGK